MRAFLVSGAGAGSEEQITDTRPMDAGHAHVDGERPLTSRFPGTPGVQVRDRHWPPLPPTARGGLVLRERVKHRQPPPPPPPPPHHPSRPVSMFPCQPAPATSPRNDPPQPIPNKTRKQPSRSEPEKRRRAGPWFGPSLVLYRCRSITASMPPSCSMEMMAGRGQCTSGGRSGVCVPQSHQPCRNQRSVSPSRKSQTSKPSAVSPR